MRGIENATPVLDRADSVTALSPSEPSKRAGSGSKRPVARTQARSLQVLLWTVTGLVLWYVNTSVLRYLNQSREVYGLFWPRHEWLFIHAISGTIALVLGPVLFWPGVREEQPVLHKTLGVAYVVGAVSGSISAYYLAYHTGFGWMFGAGLSAMATAWILCSGMAAVALWRRMRLQHREWMIRSYVVTFGFVLMRLMTDVFDTIDLGTVSDRLVFTSWASWSVPLLLAELFMQGRKVFAPSQRSPLPSASTD